MKLLSVLAVAGLAATSAVANTVTVLNPTGVFTNAGPVNSGDAVVADAWLRRNVRVGGSAGITTDFARSGNGSAYLAGGSNAKADFEYFFSDWSGKQLSNLTALSYDWYRDSSSLASGHQHPALRLYIDADGNAATTNDRGYLVYERAYNPSTSAVPTDTWQSDDVFNFNGAGASANLWQVAFGAGNHDTAGNWVPLSTWVGGFQPSTGGRLFNGNSVVFGMSFGIGSGWGAFEGAVDNVTVGFGGSSTTWNFETVELIPTPTAGALGLGGLVVVAGRRRRR